MGPPCSGPLYLSRRVAEGVAEASISRPPRAESLGASARDDRRNAAGLDRHLVVADLDRKTDFRPLALCR
eukprot:7621937-Pyramimonas_sp.AAC.1